MSSCVTEICLSDNVAPSAPLTNVFVTAWEWDTEQIRLVGLAPIQSPAVLFHTYAASVCSWEANAVLYGSYGGSALVRHR
jgi:hypothetical protein